MTPKYLLLLGAFNSKVSKLLGALIKMNEKWKETKEMEQIGSSSDSRSRDVTWFTTSRSPGVSPTFQFYAFFLFSSVAQSCPAVCDPMDCSMPGFPVITNSQSLVKLMCIESVMSPNLLILCFPFLVLPSNKEHGLPQNFKGSALLNNKIFWEGKHRTKAWREAKHKSWIKLYIF